MNDVLVEQDVELEQLCQSLEQLQEEKAKETERVNKRTEELDGEYPVVGFFAEANVFPDGSRNACRLPSEGQGTIRCLRARRPYPEEQI